LRGVEELRREAAQVQGKCYARTVPLRQLLMNPPFFGRQLVKIPVGMALSSVHSVIVDG
jgi:hypothetical protein